MDLAGTKFLDDHDGALLQDYKLLHQYSPTLKSDEDITDGRKLATDDPEKLKALRDLHKDFATEVVEVKKVNEDIITDSIKKNQSIPSPLRQHENQPKEN